MSNLLLFTSRDVYSAGSTFAVQVADTTNGFAAVSEVSFTIINGADNIKQFGDQLVFFCLKPGDVAINFTGKGQSEILYLTVVGSMVTPSSQDFYGLLLQELPQNVYNTNLMTDSEQYIPTTINGEQVYPNTAIFADNSACSQMLEDSCEVMQSIFNNAYPGYSEYNQQWEYVFNGTYSLFTNSLNPVKLIQLLFQISTQTSLNTYDLSLFISKYLYYRQPYTNTPTTFPVALDDGIRQYPGFWHLGDPVYSVLGSTTKLYTATPDTGIVWKLAYYVFNLPVNPTLQALLVNEITTVINNISRADMSHSLTTYTTSPTVNGFYPPYFTYKLDPRISIQYKALEYLGDSAYPFNINCYISNS